MPPKTTTEKIVRVNSQPEVREIESQGHGQNMGKPMQRANADGHEKPMQRANADGHKKS